VSHPPAHLHTPVHACALCRDGYSWGPEARLPGHFPLKFAVNQHFAQVAGWLAGWLAGWVGMLADGRATTFTFLRCAVDTAVCPASPRPACSPTASSLIWPSTGASCWQCWATPSRRCAGSRQRRWHTRWLPISRWVGNPLATSLLACPRLALSGCHQVATPVALAGHNQQELVKCCWGVLPGCVSWLAGM
jgi:hypothetical protein